MPLSISTETTPPDEINKRTLAHPGYRIKVQLQNTPENQTPLHIMFNRYMQQQRGHTAINLKWGCHDWPSC